ncbi:hypothetical protein KRP22_004273 [Phytophthora ramorum]|nr:Endoplasmic reticulum mannosyl-oligosaccharide 1,2-alpha-mannosidase [Phytophthora ramorum]
MRCGEDAYIAMKDDSVVYVKRGAVQKLLWAMVAAMAALSLFLLTYAHLIYLPAMSGEQGSRQFLRAGRHQPTPIASSLRAVYKKQSENFNEDQEKVVNMTRHAWHGYRKFAGWSDYLGMPSLEGGNVYGHDMALTTVDSLDTLFVMGLHDEFDEASAWVKANLSETMFRESTVSFFEVTIRSLGGLLSAYYLSGEQHFLTLAHGLGKALQTAFTCGNYVPCRSVDLAYRLSYEEPLLSEAGTFQLEFAYLAHATADDSFLLQVDHVNSIMSDLVRMHYPNGLIPVMVDWNSMRGQPGSDISVGALGDSHYEYLLKQWLLSGKKDDHMREMYVTAVAGMQAELVGRSYPSNYAFVGKRIATGELDPAMEHLTCFVPGMLALGYHHGMPTSHLELAKELTETCAQMYLQSASHLSPEITQFATEASTQDSQENDGELYAHTTQDYNILRPETVESLMILHRVTGDDIYREHGRVIMEAFEKHSKVSQGGYRSTMNVWRGIPSTKEGPMESFFVAETLKYLFLLFSDADILALDEIVFNTEAHPFPVWW